MHEAAIDFIIGALADELPLGSDSQIFLWVVNAVTAQAVHNFKRIVFKPTPVDSKPRLFAGESDFFAINFQKFFLLKIGE